MVNRLALTGVLVVGCLWCWVRVVEAEGQAASLGQDTHLAMHALESL